MSVTVGLSVAGLTARAALIVSLAIAALLLTGWRKPARVQPRSPRSASPGTAAPLREARPGVPVDHYDTEPYRAPGVVRRVAATVATGGLSLLMGTLLAIVTSFAAALTVIWLTGLLRG